MSSEVDNQLTAAGRVSYLDLPVHAPDWRDQFGYTRTSNLYYDEIMPHVSLAAWKILSAIIRETVGRENQRNRDQYSPAALSLSELCRRTGIASKNTVMRAADELGALKIIACRKYDDRVTPNDYRLNHDFTLRQMYVELGLDPVSNSDTPAEPEGVSNFEPGGVSNFEPGGVSNFEPQVYQNLGRYKEKKETERKEGKETRVRATPPPPPALPPHLGGPRYSPPITAGPSLEDAATEPIFQALLGNVKEQHYAQTAVKFRDTAEMLHELGATAEMLPGFFDWYEKYHYNPQGKPYLKSVVTHWDDYMARRDLRRKSGEPQRSEADEQWDRLLAMVKDGDSPNADRDMVLYALTQKLGGMRVLREMDERFGVPQKRKAFLELYERRDDVVEEIRALREQSRRMVGADWSGS